jgi:hypothetical protein
MWHSISQRQKSRNSRIKDSPKHDTATAREKTEKRRVLAMEKPQTESGKSETPNVRRKADLGKRFLAAIIDVAIAGDKLANTKVIEVRD